MKRDLDRLTSSQYDLLVIGGGINGAAIAHLAALNGLEVTLVEKGDFACGTSSKSTKLVHGGLRYLENFEFGLVRESLHERHIQLQSASHLVKPLKFIIPVYKDDQRPLWMMKLGVSLYDLLSGKYLIGKHQSLTADEVLKAVPILRRETLVGGVSYFDAQMDDARLCLENVLSAAQNGANVANYVEAKNLITENGKTVGVTAEDKLTSRQLDIKAKKVVVAVGPWTNLFMAKERSRAPQKVRTTKGIHIIYHDQIANDAVLIPFKNERRIFFVIPWMGNSLIGTTDTDYSGNPDEVDVEEEDVEYLFDEVRRVFPTLSLTYEDIVTTFAGLRPLVFNEGSPSAVSRRHVIEQSYSGIFYVMGGKYTTYRKIAEDVLKMVSKKKLVDTHETLPLYGGGEIEEAIGDVASEFDLEDDTVEAIMDTYGTKYREVIGLTQRDPNLRARIDNRLPYIKAQIVYSLEKEMAQNFEDIFQRRLSLDYTGLNREDCELQIKEAISNHRIV